MKPPKMPDHLRETAAWLVMIQNESPTTIRVDTATIQFLKALYKAELAAEKDWLADQIARNREPLPGEHRSVPASGNYQSTKELP